MATNQEIELALEKVIRIFNNLDFSEKLNNLATLYKSNHHTSGSSTKNFKDLCKNKIWEDFSYEETKFLKSFGVYEYMGIASYTMCIEVISNNYNNSNIIASELNKHYVNSLKTVESCKRLLRALKDGHFRELGSEDYEDAFNEGNTERILLAINKISEIVKDEVKVPEEEFEKINKKLDELKVSVDKLADNPSLIKNIFTGVIQEIAVSFITSPENKTLFLNAIKNSFGTFKNLALGIAG